MAGLTSLPRKKNIKGQPHKLAYITEAESDLLKSRGGAGKPVKGTKGVPAYFDEDFSDDGFSAEDFDDDPTDLASADPSRGPGPGQETGVGGGRGGDPRDFGFDPREAELSALQAQAQRDEAITGKLVGDETFGLPFDPFTPEFTGFGFPDVPTTSQGVVDSLKNLKERGFKKRAQSLLDTRFFSPDLLGIPQMNKLEEEGFKTFGLGYRGDFEARSPFGLFRQDYDPNSLTGAGTDEASTNKSLFAEFSRENPSLTTVEALAEYNATMSNPDSQLSISDVQSMGFELNAPVGPQADFREAEAQRGLAQGIGLMAQTIAAGSPIGALTDIALSGRGEGYGKGVLGHFSDMVKDLTDIELPDIPDFGIPSTQEMAVDLFGPEQDTMAPGSFGMGLSSSREMSTPTDTDVGFTGPTDSYDYGFPRSREIAPPPVQKPVIKEKEEVIETPSPAFPVRDTTPPSRVSRIANIYGIDEDAAKRMLGIV